MTPIEQRDRDKEREAFESYCRQQADFDGAMLYRRDMPGSLRLGEYVSPLIQGRWEGWQARAALRSVPPGWRLVPVEPTEAMLDKGQHANSEWLNDNAPIGEGRYRLPAKGVYEAMLSAAPTQGQPHD